MKEFVSVKKNTDFGRIYHQGKSYGNKLLVMYKLSRGQGQLGRVGISVSKKVGNSVVRHRTKRRIRECFRTHLSRWKDGQDIVIIARRNIVNSDYESLEKALISAGKHLDIYEEDLH